MIALNVLKARRERLWLSLFLARVVFAIADSLRVFVNVRGAREG